MTAPAVATCSVCLREWPEALMERHSAGTLFCPRSEGLDCVAPQDRPVLEPVKGTGDLCAACGNDLVVEGEEMCAACLAEVFAEMDALEGAA